MNKEINIHANQLILEGDTPVINQFNRCSDEYLKSIDENLSTDERNEAKNNWLQERQILELGLF